MLCEAHLPLAVAPFLNSLSVQHANNCDQFKPHCFIRYPGLTISAPMACLAAVRLREMGTNVLCLCVSKREAQRKRQKEGRVGEKRRGETQADGATGRNVVAACQLQIRALVCPLWVRVRD